MKKFTFTLEVVSDHEFDTASLADGFLAQAVSAVSNYNEAVCAIKPVIIKELKEQGFKVWRARVGGVTEASLRAEKIESYKGTPACVVTVS